MEEDFDAVRTYRREGSALPRSRRPRHILEFGQDGRMKSLVAGPADARQAREGAWTSPEPGRVAIRWDDEREATTLHVLECDEGVLKIRTLSGSIE
jgi:hypothetical protein